MLKLTATAVIVLSFAWADTSRTVIGPYAYVSVEEADMRYLARIDTGAQISSLHAVNISIKGKKGLVFSKDPAFLMGNPVSERISNASFRLDTGSMIEFDTLNEKGELKHICAPVLKVVKINNAQGREYRYVISLGLKYGDILKFTEVNLRDRSEMRHKLLIGRDWLKDDFVVDISKDTQ